MNIFGELIGRALSFALQKSTRAKVIWHSSASLRTGVPTPTLPCCVETGAPSNATSKLFFSHAHNPSARGHLASVRTLDLSLS